MKNWQAYVVSFLFVSIVIFIPKATHKVVVDSVFHNVPDNASIIVLSPHLDDAVLSLGGFLSKYKGRAEVATFFTKRNQNPIRTYWDKISGFKDSVESINNRIEENNTALNISSSTAVNFVFNDFQYRRDEDSSKIIEDISSLIDSILSINSNRNIYVYGPAEFGDNITHPDHLLLHKAFIQVSKGYMDNKNINFYIYEDFPYVNRYMKLGRGELKNYLEQQSNIKLKPEIIFLSNDNLNNKIIALEKYSSQIKAFNSFNEHLIDETKDFTLNRTSSGPSEIVYRILP